MDKAKVINMENPSDLSLCKKVFEKFGERWSFSWGEYFTRSGEVGLTLYILKIRR
ncbi:MAG: hypothetical protein HDR88_15110 [Bacteroides sp.]|nr:hypothetical protein [Bacteroides sp.]